MICLVVKFITLKNGIWEEYISDDQNKLYVFSKNGTRIYFDSLEEITEQ